MQYRKFGKLGIDVSALGFGAMRLPTTPDGKIDEPEAIHMIRHAIDSGVTYVDTAYPYHDGQSEFLVGKALQDGYRERTLLATKLPMFLVKETGDFQKYLNEQLSKLQVDCVDFYLFHSMDASRFELLKKCNLIAEAEKAKAEGKIKYIGFSFHDNLDVFKQIIDYYDKWDFCQIQYNYINTDYQAGTEGLEYAASKDIPVIIMEPLLGGRLANPPQAVAAELPAERNHIDNALQFLWNRPEVAVVLSGMSTMQQLDDNLSYASHSGVGSLSEQELKQFDTAKKVYDDMALVPCTRCNYCMPCPQGLDIPRIYRAYNTTVYTNKEDGLALYKALETLADECIACGLCEGICPQHIMSTELMPQIAAFFAD